ncbi:hypothetical protein F4V60_03085 [Corynebacterium flavescens]|nr:hypothetical protein F4V60_03085 [Corynebacterium flavescens]
MTTREDTHGSDYFTSIFLLPQLCNSTRSRESVFYRSLFNHFYRGISLSSPTFLHNLLGF